MSFCVICVRNYVNLKAHVNRTKKHKINSINTINKYIKTFNTLEIYKEPFNILNYDVICCIMDLMSYTNANSLCRTSTQLMLHYDYILKKPGNKTKCKFWSINSAIIYGHLELVDYLFCENLLSNKNLTDFSASQGHLHIFQYFINKGCEFTYKSILSAMDNQHFSIIIYIYSIERENDFLDYFNNLYNKNHMLVVKHLIHVKTYIQKHADINGVMYLTYKKILCKNPHLQKFFMDISIMGIFGAMSPLLGQFDFDKQKAEFKKYFF